MSTILVVDDQEGVRRVLRIFLEQAEYTVVEAVDAGSALRVAGETLPEVIVMDWALPGGDGLAIARRIRNDVPALATVPVILFTALRVESQQKREIIREFGGFVAKTTGSDTIIEAVATVLAKTAFIVHEDEGMRSIFRRMLGDLGFFVKTERIEHAFSKTKLDVRPWRLVIVQGSVALREQAHVARLREVSDRVLVITGGLTSDLERISPFCDEIIEMPVTPDDLARILGAPQRP